MPLTNILERKVRLNENSKHQSLYKWCLNEYDEKGNRVGDDYIPWVWTLYFTGSSIKLSNSFSTKGLHGSSLLEPNNDIDKKLEVKQECTIDAILHPGICSDGVDLDKTVEFQMFGTNRSIKEFRLTICQVESGKNELSSMHAIPSYEQDYDFGGGATGDYVGFYIALNKERFEEIKRLIESRLVDSLYLSVSVVSGFFARWSPDIHTSLVKIISPHHEVEGVEDLEKISTDKGTKVGEFDLRINTKNKLDLKQEFSTVDIEKQFKVLANPAGADELEPSYFQKEAEHQSASANHKLIGSLKTPLWFIFAALVILIFTK